ncbi:hypothetical protein [Yoonia sp. MH D7]
MTRLVAAALVAAPLPVIAQEDAVKTAPSISVELNSIVQGDHACQLTFLLSNSLDVDIDGLVLETVLLTKDGAVDRLTLFDMRDVPSNRPRVRQFSVPHLTCDDLGQVLINGIATCEGSDLTPTACTDAVTLSSRTDIEVLG